MIIAENLDFKVTDENITESIRVLIEDEAPEDREKRRLYVLGIAPGGWVDYIDLVYLASSLEMKVRPSEVLRTATMKGAAAIIPVYLGPDQMNPDVARALRLAGKLLGIEIGAYVQADREGITFKSPYIYLERDRYYKWADLGEKSPWGNPERPNIQFSHPLKKARRMAQA